VIQGGDNNKVSLLEDLPEFSQKLNEDVECFIIPPFSRIWN
jgi:hypothetical protein